MPWGIMPGPMLGAFGEGMPWERGWEPIGVMPRGLRAGIDPEPGPIMRGPPWWWFITIPLLFIEGRLGERAGGESSSELATVLMASWYKGVELGIANLDMRDIMMERGFWDSVGSGGMVYGLPDGTLPGWDMGPDGAPDEGWG